jgi:hypothetical protein
MVRHFNHNSLSEKLSNVLTACETARIHKVIDHVLDAAYRAVTPHAQTAVDALLVPNGALSALLKQQFQGEPSTANVTTLRVEAYRALDGLWTETIMAQLSGAVYDSIRASVQAALGLHVATAVFGCRSSTAHLDVGSLMHTLFLHVVCATFRCFEFVFPFRISSSCHSCLLTVACPSVTVIGNTL